MPWPIRWILGAIMLGFSAAIALWAFEFGKGLTGFDGKAKDELIALRSEVLALRGDRDKALTISNTSGSLLTAEKAALEKISGQVKQLESENRQLRDDLGFFEKLLPAANADDPQCAGRFGVGFAAALAGAGDSAGQKRARLQRQAGRDHQRHTCR
jgi:hypothetical protein